ncbi:MAG TPA: methyltransferase domain-containing protein [Longimicrobiales bacterium]|nr:methyltransferase domain-containing protein [Longimicrobiales bacterium]
MTRYEIADCPACGGTEHTLIAGSDDIRDELEQLWAFHTRRLRGDTPPARLHDRIAFSQDPPLRIVRCDRCTLLFRNPRERADELVDTYGDEEPDDTALHTLFDNQKQSYRTQALRLSRIAGRKGRGLEIGSYVGAFLAAAADIGWDFTGIDVNESANDFASSRSLTVRTGTIDDADPDTKYDAVAFWNCFDQLPDPRAAAIAARERTRDGGLVCIRVPNGAFYATWRARLSTPLRPLARLLLAHNNLLGFPYRHGFSPASLTSLLGNVGFEVMRTFGDSLVPIADRWTRPWAHAEERLVKTALRPLPAAHSPWLEMYARAR